MQQNRIQWVDAAKGITMLLVILGHSVGGALRGAVFSFHMPLFFILSGLTLRLSKTRGELYTKIRHASRRLLLPAALMYLGRVVFELAVHCAAFSQYSPADWLRYLSQLGAVFVAGSGVPVSLGGTSIPAIGIPWFLFVLFSGRALFDYLHLRLPPKAFLLACALCSVAGVALGRLQWLPFSFDITLAVLPLFWFGMLLKRHGFEHKTAEKLLLSFAAWFSLLLLFYFTTGNYLELALRRYTLYPLCFICAAAGTLLVLYSSVLLTAVKPLARPLCYLGRHSLTLLVIHHFDDLYRFLWELTDSSYLNACLRIAIDLLVFALCRLICRSIHAQSARKNAAAR